MLFLPSVQAEKTKAWRPIRRVRARVLEADISKQTERHNKAPDVFVPLDCGDNVALSVGYQNSLCFHEFRPKRLLFKFRKSD
jgi:hypothetical protein